MRDNLPNMLRAAAKEWRKGNKVVATGATRYDAALDEAADAIEELSKLNAEITKRELKLRMEKPRWIPVAEKLPESEEYVWAVYKNSLFPNGKSHHKTLKYNGKMWIDENGYRYLPANITHWKQRDPLPQPPKEET